MAHAVPNAQLVIWRSPLVCSTCSIPAWIATPRPQTFWSIAADWGMQAVHPPPCGTGMSSTDKTSPVVEIAPGEPPEPAVSTRVLNLRIRQQEILADLGVIALRGTPFMELMDQAVRLCAEGLESEFCKILDTFPPRIGS